MPVCLMWLFAAAHEKMWLLVSDRLATPALVEDIWGYAIAQDVDALAADIYMELSWFSHNCLHVIGCQVRDHAQLVK